MTTLLFFESAGRNTCAFYFYCLFTDNKEEKINDIAFRNILNSRSMLLEQPDYKKQRKIHSEEGKDDEQTD